MVDLSILTISRNIENLEKLFSSIPDAVGNLSYEVLCSWNGEEQPKLRNIPEIVPFKLHYIRPYNFSKNNNELASISNGKYLLFLNDDISLDNDCIINALNYLIGDTNVGIVGANLRYPNGLIQHAGILLDKTRKPYHRFKGICHYRDPRVTSSQEVTAVTGAFILICREEFMAIKFDEKCKVAAQDVVICFDYREKFSKKIMYVASATAIHYENLTRKLFNQKDTPMDDLLIMNETINKCYRDEDTVENCNDIKLRVVTEKPGWIMHRKGEEICKRLKNSKINEDYPQANVHYYINYGYYSKRPRNGVVVANFTHFDPSLHHEKWIKTAKEVDHCVAVSEEAAENLRRFGISDKKITIIKVGADISFKPMMTIGLVGRTYSGGRKGEHLVAQLLQDSDVMEGLKIVATNECWGVPVRKYDHFADFYRSIDYLLVPALIEGGPVPFMEALACGTLSIAPPIGVVPEFPHIEYKTGDIDSLKDVIKDVKKNFLGRKNRISDKMSNYNWSTWANQHISLFKDLLKT